MIRWIARRELVEHLQSARVFALSLICMILLPATTYINVSVLRARERFAQELDEARMLGSEGAGSLNDQGASRFGWRSGIVAPDPALRAVRHPEPSEVLALGVSGSIPAFWQFSTEGVADGPPADAQARSAGAGGIVDVASLVQTVLGLLAVLVAFDSVSGELESGRMRTILAHPVSRAEVLAGKFVGAYGSVAVPLMCGGAASFVVLWMRGLPVFEGAFLATTVGILLASLLYLATMLALGVAVSAVTREARTSLVALLVLWICSTLVAPSVAGLASEAVSPVQPAELMRASLAGNVRQLERERAQRLAEIWDRVTGSRGVPTDGVIDADKRELYRTAIATDEQSFSRRKRAIINELQGERERQLVRQARIELAIGRLSPAVTFMRACQALAGTDDAMRVRWRQEVDRAQRALEAATFDRDFGVELFAADLDFERIIYWPDASQQSERVPAYDDLPQFSHRASRTIERLADAAPDLCLLGVECVGLMLVAAHAYFRIDV